MDLLIDEKIFQFSNFYSIYKAIIEDKDPVVAEQLLNMQGFSTNEYLTIDEISHFPGVSIIGTQRLQNFYLLGKKGKDNKTYINPKGKEVMVPQQYYYDKMGNEVDVSGDFDKSAIRGEYLPLVHICSTEAELKKEFMNWFQNKLMTDGANGRQMRKSKKLFDVAEHLQKSRF